MSNTFLKQTVKKFLVASYFLVPGGHFGPLETRESSECFSGRRHGGTHVSSKRIEETKKITGRSGLRAIHAWVIQKAAECSGLSQGFVYSAALKPALTT